MQPEILVHEVTQSFSQKYSQVKLLSGIISSLILLMFKSSNLIK